MSWKDRFSGLRNWKSIEQASYVLVWAILGFLPLIFWDFGDPSEKMRIIGGWVRILPFFLIFILHNTVLLPQLLLKKRYLYYFLGIIALILLVNYWFVFSDSLHDFLIEITRKSREGLQEGVDRIRESNRHLSEGHGRGHGKGYKYLKWRGPRELIFAYNVIVSLLIVGFNAALKFTIQWLRQDQLRKEAEKEAIESQLTALQNQVSPHFFMNTLNNIHALIDYNTEDAKDALLRLSKMMRYLLYESDHGKTSLKKEIEFLQSYIELMKLRIQPDVELKISFPKTVPDVQIFSLLSISFLENAFKYGIDPKGKSFIHILFEVIGSNIHFNCRNSRYPEEMVEKEVGGIGIENARKRMDLIYGADYSLNIYSRENEFEVDLIFPVS